MTRYLLTAALILIGCSSVDRAQLPELSEEQIADTAYHHLRTHLDLMMAGEVEQALEYYVNSPDLVYASDASLVVGWDAVAELMNVYNKMLD